MAKEVLLSIKPNSMQFPKYYFEAFLHTMTANEWRALCLMVWNGYSIEQNVLEDILNKASLDRFVRSGVIILDRSVYRLETNEANIKKEIFDEKKPGLKKMAFDTDAVTSEVSDILDVVNFMPHVKMSDGARQASFHFFKVIGWDPKQPYTYIQSGNTGEWAKWAEKVSAVVGNELRLIDIAVEKLTKGGYSVTGMRSIFKTVLSVKSVYTFVETKQENKGDACKIEPTRF